MELMPFSEPPYSRAELLAMDGRGAYGWRLAELRQARRDARTVHQKLARERELRQVEAHFRRAYPGRPLPA